MCKTRFDSQRMILNGFKKNHFSKYVNGTRDPTPIMANDILNFHFFGKSPLSGIHAFAKIKEAKNVKI